MRHGFLRAVMLCVVLLPAPVHAEFPDRPLRIVVGVAPGGAGDFTARLMAEMARSAFRQDVVVENRTGANGAIAAEFVARNGREGYVVMQCPMALLAITPFLPGQRLPIDVAREIVPIANVALTSFVLVVPAQSRFRALEDLLAEARANPGRLTFASAGTGSVQHIAGEMLKRAAGVELVHVPFRGGAPAIVELVAGRIDFMIANLGDVPGQLREGSLRLLALADDRGHPNYQAEPISRTVPGYSVAAWAGLCGSKDMPSHAITRWAQAIEQGLAQPEIRTKLLDQGLTPYFEAPQALAERLEHDRRAFRDIIQSAGIRAD